jgi:hypothetical protein
MLQYSPYISNVIFIILHAAYINIHLQGMQM